MSPTNLGTCIGFTLLRPEVDDPATIISDANLACELFKSLIEEHDSYFSADEIAVVDKVSELPEIPKSTPVIRTSSLFRNLSQGATPLEKQTVNPGSNDSPITEIKARERCSHCNKFVFGVDKELFEEKLYHPECLRKLRLQDSNLTPTSARNEYHSDSKVISIPEGSLTSRTTPDYKILNQKRPLPPPPQKVQALKSQFLKDYEMHRSMSTMNLDEIKEKSQMNDEQFRANLESLVQKMQDGEIDSHDKDHFKNDLAQIVFQKQPKRHTQIDKKKNDKSKFDPIAVGAVGIPMKNTNTIPEIKSKRRTTISLEKFGRRTTEHMDRLFSKKNNDFNITISASRESRRTRPNFDPPLEKPTTLKSTAENNT